MSAFLIGWCSIPALIAALMLAGALAERRGR